MLKTNLDNLIDTVKKELVSRLGKNLQLLVLFGTSNNQDFNPKLSDVDFFLLAKKIDYTVLKKVALVREKTKKNFNVQVDIQPYLLDELLQSLKNKSSFHFFNRWALKAVKEGHQKTIYKNPKLEFNYRIQLKDIKKDALDRANHYIIRLRELFSSNHILVRGEHKLLSKLEFVKISVSGYKCILAFLLAYKGIFVFSEDEILKESKKNFMELNNIVKATKQKRKGIYDFKTLKKAYNEIEKLYQKEIKK